MLITPACSCVGLDSQVLNLQDRKLTKVRSTGALDPDREQLVLVLANLAVRVDRRKSGIGRSLLASCDSFLEV
jgi:predicted N-acetyltransferase YhbS